jgi:hypothetical protein
MTPACCRPPKMRECSCSGAALSRWRWQQALQVLTAGGATKPAQHCRASATSSTTCCGFMLSSALPRQSRQLPNYTAAKGRRQCSRCYRFLHRVWGRSRPPACSGVCFGEHTPFSHNTNCRCASRLEATRAACAKGDSARTNLQRRRVLNAGSERQRAARRW